MIIQYIKNILKNQFIGIYTFGYYQHSLFSLIDVKTSLVLNVL